MAPPGEWNTY